MEAYNFTKDKTKLRKCIVCNEKKECYTFKNVGICLEHIDRYLDNKITCSCCKKKFRRISEVWENKSSKLTFCSSECIEKHKENLKARDELDIWLKDYYKVDKLSPYIYKQMDDFIKKEMTYQGMKFALDWWINIKGQHIEPNTIGIIPLIYYQARDFYNSSMKQLQTKKHLEDINYSNIKDGKVVLISSAINNKRKDKIIIKGIKGIDYE